jgi:hypothetical protein
MEALLTAMMLWLHANFDVPKTDQHPQIRYATEREIVVFRYRAFTSERQREVLAAYEASPEKGRKVVAVYDEGNRTIMLPQDWSGGTPAELSILLHELVHHLQAAAGLKYECPAMREQLAYSAQEKWLGLFNRSLASEFGIDEFTLKIATSCVY